ncbi:enoyl-CoA hydratase/isomerase family protein [uncultured Sphingomonas sp.]|uniref:enoyl-CoA hydratase/isomerase family protein n=1 Tax=uncultured Sphingomonas sp. TaxID=158754 RepID=UPI0026308856|nr:enoyl-CoA hydratase/isomerase family protein [uncultured Sphingomonas sp.]
MMEDIRLERDGAVGHIVVARGSGNTIRPQTMREIGAAVDELEADQAIRCLVLRAEGKHFSAGADFTFLDALVETPAVDVQAQVYTHFQGAVRRFYACAKPTIALVQGAAVTVGCELALAADFRIASEDAMFQESWIRLGIMPPLGGTFLLPRIIGAGRAAKMCLRGRAVRAQEALAIGLVGEVVARDALATRGDELARELAASAPLAYSAVKRALHRGLETSMEIEWAANLPTQAVLLGSDDFREGLSAAKERRTAAFSGR